MGEGRLGPAGGDPLGYFFFSHAYVPSQAALSEPRTMCSFCPQPFQPPVHSLCICCHTGHPGWQATTGTHCAALMKHGAGDTGWLEPAEAGVRRGAPRISTSGFFLRVGPLSSPPFTSHGPSKCRCKKALMIGSQGLLWNREGSTVPLGGGELRGEPGRRGAP